MSTADIINTLKVQADRPAKVGQWSEAALRVLRERYLLRNEAGEVIETPEDMCWRVAMAIAQGEAKHGADEATVRAWAERFYDLMVERKFLPNSPTMMNAGKGNNLQYSACYVLPVGDSMEEIFDAIKNAALIHKSGGGTGFAFSRLRPAGSLVRSSGGKASGPVSFLRVFNAATEAVKQGGTRRGANMGILRVDHPDIEEFITCKLDGSITNFNISVAATDAFMRAVMEDTEYEILAQPGWPDGKGGRYQGGEVIGRKRARDVFQKIVEAAWRTGDPGMIFIDRINASPANPTPALGQIEATNPCVAGDTWVLTESGPRQVRELVGKPCRVIVQGYAWNTGPEGFFATGKKPVLRLRTKEGHTLRLTANHLVARVTRRTRWTLEVEWAEAGELKPGDEIVLHNHRNLEGWEGPGTEEEGYLIGLLLGDGTLKKEAAVLSVWGAEDEREPVLAQAERYIRTLPHRSDSARWHPVAGRDEWRMESTALRDLAFRLDMGIGHKSWTPTIERTSSNFYRGFLRGLFDADGSVQGSREKGVSIRLSQSDRNVLEGVQRMLLRLGIHSHIYSRREAGEALLPEGHDGARFYPTQPQYELIISNDNILLFAEQIGFTDPAKRAALDRLLSAYRRLLNRERFIARVEAVEPDGIEEVYDVRVPGVHAFDANGLYVHNCGEQPLLPNEACNLGSINLLRFVKPAGQREKHQNGHQPERHPGIDWEELERVVRLSVRFLDDVIEVNPYPLPEVRKAVEGNRRIGLGVMGWADVLFALGIPYDSEEALELAHQVMGFINEIGHDESARLAEERGPFPNWPQSIYADDRPLRNATVTTIAPTGTISIIAGASSGIEPLFALAFSHIVGERHLTFIDPVFEQVARERGFYSEELMEKVAETGTLQGITDLPEDVRRVFVTAHEIAPEWHVRMQAAFQAHTDNAVSKTINLPNSATIEDVANAYLLAYKEGCLGITVFRDGCKGTQVLHAGTKSTDKGAIEDEQEAKKVVTKAPVPMLGQLSPDGYYQKKPRPRVLHGTTYRWTTPLGTAYVTINSDSSGQPFEVFLNVGKAGSDVAAVSEALGRLISLILRLPSSLAPRERLEEVVEQLAGIGGGRPLGFGPNAVRSLPDAISQVLAEYLKGEAPEKPAEEVEVAQLSLPLDRPTGDLCPECGQATLVFEEGCKKCLSCGFSEC
ncbi:MAG TPA: ribonucleoside reductase class II [Caldilineae bacterium]|nr:ribonucleoside reductase class II [Caldilineae bacterium]